MNDRLRLAESVGRDWQNLSTEERQMVRKAMAAIDEDPIIGAPLLEPFHGYWTYRAGWLRIIYKIFPDARFVAILSITRAGESLS